MIPRAITRELEKLVRDRDRWKRLAQDRAPVRSADRKREIAGRDGAVRGLLFLVAIEGTSGMTRGAKGKVWSAVETLRPDVHKVWSDEGGDEHGAHVALHRFFPEAERGDG
jgi:hypothetical protein